MQPTQLVKNHPAETAMPLATVLAALIASIFDFDNPDTIIYLALALSFIPAIVTWIVNLTKNEPDVNSSSTDTPGG